MSSTVHFAEIAPREIYLLELRVDMSSFGRFDDDEYNTTSSRTESHMLDGPPTAIDVMIVQWFAEEIS